MDLHLDIHNLFRTNEMKEFAHLSNMPGSIFVTPSPKNKIYNSLIEGNQLYMFKPQHLELFDRVRSEFVTRAGHRIMQQPHINSLTIDFLLGSQHQHIIHEWISSAISKGAQHIHLSFSHHDYGMPNIQPYIFPTNTLFSDDHQNTKPLKHLHLTNCLLLPCPNFSGFKHLETLVLQELIVGNEMLLCLLTNSYLENLTFIQCHFIRSSHTTYTISSTMHHLKIITSLFLKSVISISAPNLSSFEYRDKILSISSIDAPQLSNCSLTPLDLDTPSQEHLEIPHAFALLASLPKLQTLSLCLYPKQVARFPPTICHLQHLTQMDLFFIGPQDESDDYFLILKIVMACPRLQKLAFGILCPSLFPNESPRKQHSGFSHSELKSVELYGCVGQMIEIELAIQFLENASSLQHITFGPRARINLGHQGWRDGSDNPHWFSAGKNLIQEKLQDYVVNKTTKLIFH